MSKASEILTRFGLTEEGESEELAHYGIKGMKWGRRRPVGPDGRVVRGAVKSADHVNSRTSKRKRLSTMSNQEIQQLNNRLQLERTNRDLQARGGLAKIKRGTAAAGTVLAVGTTITTAYNFAQSPAGQAIKKRLFSN